MKSITTFPKGSISCTLPELAAPFNELLVPPVCGLFFVPLTKFPLSFKSTV